MAVSVILNACSVKYCVDSTHRACVLPSQPFFDASFVKDVFTLKHADCLPCFDRKQTNRAVCYFKCSAFVVAFVVGSRAFYSHCKVTSTHEDHICIHL